MKRNPNRKAVLAGAAVAVIAGGVVAGLGFWLKFGGDAGLGKAGQPTVFVDPMRKAELRHPERIFVLNHDPDSGQDEIVAVDPKADAKIGTIPTKNNPQFEVGPGGEKVYVIDTDQSGGKDEGRLQVYDGRRTLQPLINPFPLPQRAAYKTYTPYLHVTPDGNHLVSLGADPADPEAGMTWADVIDVGDLSKITKRSTQPYPYTRYSGIPMLSQSVDGENVLLAFQGDNWQNLNVRTMEFTDEHQTVDAHPMPPDVPTLPQYRGIAPTMHEYSYYRVTVNGQVYRYRGEKLNSGPVYFVDLKPREEVYPSAVALASDDQRLFVGVSSPAHKGTGFDRVEIVEAATGKKLGVIPLDQPLRGLTLLSDDTLALYGPEAGKILLYDAADPSAPKLTKTLGSVAHPVAVQGH
jgi:hypothetical protein